MKHYFVIDSFYDFSDCHCFKHFNSENDALIEIEEMIEKHIRYAKMPCMGDTKSSAQERVDNICYQLIELDVEEDISALSAVEFDCLISEVRNNEAYHHIDERDFTMGNYAERSFNAHSFEHVTNEKGDDCYFDAVVVLMDDEIREQLHNELAPCTRQAFFEAYAKAHKEKYGEDFEPWVGGQW